MAKKYGDIRNGRKMRRGNNTGTLYRKKKSGKPFGPWYMVFSERTPEGKLVRIHESTRTEDREVALSLLKKTAIERGYDGRDEASRIDKLLERKHNIDNAHEKLERERLEREKLERERLERERLEKEAKKRDDNAIRFVNAFIYYQDSVMRSQSSSRTLAIYEQEYNTFVEWIKREYPTIDKMRDFTREMAQSFIKHLTETRSVNTRNHYLTFLRSFWRVLRWNKDAQLAIDPWEGILTEKREADQVRHKELTFDELKRIGATLRHESVQGEKIKNVFLYEGINIRDELRILFAIGIYTGLRLGDCACFSWSDIDLTRGIIDTIPHKTKRYKRHVILPIHPILKNILEEQFGKSHGAYVLPTIATIYQTQSSMLAKRVQAILKASNIVTKTPTERGARARTLVGFHSLRHTFVSIMLNAGVDSMMVEKMVGHSSTSMTAHYFHQHATALARGMSKLPAIISLTNKNELDAIDAESVVTYEDTTDHNCIANLKELILSMSTDQLNVAIDIMRNEVVKRGGTV